MHLSLTSVLLRDSKGKDGPPNWLCQDFQTVIEALAVGCLCSVFLIATVTLYCDNLSVFANRAINSIRAGTRLIKQIVA